MGYHSPGPHGTERYTGAPYCYPESQQGTKLDDSRLTIMNRRGILRALTAAFAGLNAASLTSMPVSAVSSLPVSQQGGSATPFITGAGYVHELIEANPATTRIVDVSPLRTYRDSHIPGAVHAFWEDTVDREYPHFGAVVTQGENQQKRLEHVRSLGLKPEVNVVAYDNQSGFRAARIVWYLRFLGFERVAMLDGGLRAWREAGLSAQSGVASIDEVSSTSVTPQDGFYVVTRQLLDRMESRSPLLVDTRTDEERMDDLDGAIPTGTIPGSVRFPWTLMVDAAKSRIQDLGQLKSALDQAGVEIDREIILFARFGVDTALPWLVLKHLGYPSVVTYDRGWVEWASRPDLEYAPL
ncbi:hypothetical protein BH23CHL4_BH23CHL4_02710 [soil metagenome]